MYKSKGEERAALIGAVMRHFEDDKITGQLINLLTPSKAPNDYPLIIKHMGEVILIANQLEIFVGSLEELRVQLLYEEPSVERGAFPPNRNPPPMTSVPHARFAEDPLREGFREAEPRARLRLVIIVVFGLLVMAGLVGNALFHR